MSHEAPKCTPALASIAVGSPTVRVPEQHTGLPVPRFDVPERGPSLRDTPAPLLHPRSLPELLRAQWICIAESYRALASNTPHESGTAADDSTESVTERCSGPRADAPMRWRSSVVTVAWQVVVTCGAGRRFPSSPRSADANVGPVAWCGVRCATSAAVVQDPCETQAW